MLELQFLFDSSLLLFAGKMLGQILVTKQTGPQGKIVSKVRRALLLPFLFLIIIILFVQFEFLLYPHQCMCILYSISPQFYYYDELKLHHMNTLQFILYSVLFCTWNMFFSLVSLSYGWSVSHLNVDGYNKLSLNFH